MPNTKTKRASSRSQAQSKNNGKSANQKNTAPVSNSQLDKFFEDSLKDIYWAEKHLTKALPKMEKAATSDELKEAIDNHLAQTEEQIARLEQVFEALGKKAQAKKCDAMEGLIKEGESVIEETEDGSATRDVAIICAAQKVEHYEIAAYGSLVTLAQVMGHEEIAEILEQTLDEEKETDELLTEIAMGINWQAEAEGEEGEEGEEVEGSEDDEEEEEEK